MRDIENSYLDLESGEQSVMEDLIGHSITYRIAIGPRGDRKAFTLQISTDFGGILLERRVRVLGYGAIRIVRGHRPARRDELGVDEALSRFSFGRIGSGAHAVKCTGS